MRSVEDLAGQSVPTQGESGPSIQPKIWLEGSFSPVSKREATERIWADNSSNPGSGIVRLAGISRGSNSVLGNRTERSVGIFQDNSSSPVKTSVTSATGLPVRASTSDNNKRVTSSRLGKPKPGISKAYSSSSLAIQYARYSKLGVGINKRITAAAIRRYICGESSWP